MSGDPLALEQLRIHDSLMSKYRAERADDHQIIAQYALPQDSNITTTKTESVSGWTDLIFDTTTIQAMETLASGLFNWWTPPNQGWAELESPEELKANNDADEATNWLGKCSDSMMKELGRSNFYMTKATGDLGLSVFATDAILVDESDSGTELFNFIHCKIGTYTIEENYKGIVDTLRREIKMTYRQICQKFGKDTDTIPEAMEKASKGEKGNQKEFKILHCIFPREDSKRIKGAKDGKNKAYASVYLSIDFKETMRVSGYDECPILCRRFKKWATVWGYGPAYLALPDSRQVNYVQQYLDASAELHVNPRIITPEAIDGDVDLRPGGETVVPDNETKPEEWGTVSEYKLGLEMQEQRRKAIRDACFNDAFKLLNSQPLLDKDMTAYEISQRLAEQLQNMTAIDARMVMEFINPCIHRVFAIMYSAGKFGQAPKALMQDLGAGKKGLVQPEVVVTSRFNDALRALKNRAAEETIKFVLPITEQNKPELWDVFDLEAILREYARNAGIAPDSLRKLTGANSVQAIRDARQKLIQQQRALASTEQLGKAGKALGGAPDFIQDQVKDALNKQGKKAA
jgi:hypothetical protein